MSLVVFYLLRVVSPDAVSGQPKFALVPQCDAFETDDIAPVMARCKELRLRADVCHVTVSSELSSMVGKAGVDSVVNGRTPDGQLYDWSKADRAGKMRRSDYTKPIARSE